MSSSKRYSFTSSFPICMPFISFCCLIAMTRTFRIILSKLPRANHFLYWKNVFSLLPLSMMYDISSNYCTVTLISHASKAILKILQATLQQYMNHEIPDVQDGFRKGRGTRDQIANICWIIKKAREFQ